MKHHIIDSLPTLSEYALDDEIEMNTQTGSHWDSLKHVRIPHHDQGKAMCSHTELTTAVCLAKPTSVL